VALPDRLQARGWRITPQRRAVLRALDGEHVHLVPEVSLATVYNTLNELVAMGEISEIRLADGPPGTTPRWGPVIITCSARDAG
jgi:Fe2+ or Zn2+ uptake regulation protein